MSEGETVSVSASVSVSVSESGWVGECVSE